MMVTFTFLVGIALLSVSHGRQFYSLLKRTGDWGFAGVIAEPRRRKRGCAGY
jgi:hypothetical protein